MSLEEELQAWWDSVRYENKHKVTLREIYKIIPRIMEAGEHNNRQLVLALVDQVIRMIANNEATLFCHSVVGKAYYKIKSELKQYVIKSAYVKEDDFVMISEEGDRLRNRLRAEYITGSTYVLRPGAMNDVTSGAPKGKRTKKKLRSQEVSPEACPDVSQEVEENEELDTGGGGLVQGSKKDVLEFGMRLTSYDMEISENFSEKIPTTTEIHLDKASKICNKGTHNGPFSIDDFAVSTEASKQASLDNLIAAVDNLIEEA